MMIALLVSAPQKSQEIIISKRKRCQEENGIVSGNVVKAMVFKLGWAQHEFERKTIEFYGKYFCSMSFV